MKNQSGITLIALIITIIVLLILAGVSISLVIGQNGVLEKAQETVKVNKEATVKEQVALAWAACETEYLTTGRNKDKSGYFTVATLKQNLPDNIEIAENGLGFSATGDSELICKITENGVDTFYRMKVTDSGEVSIIGEPSSEPQILTLASQIDSRNYGDYVNYEMDLGIKTAGNALSDGKVPLTDWRIFYEDSQNVYLISSDYLPVSKFPSGVFGEDNNLYNGYWAKDSVDETKLTTSGTITSNDGFLFSKLSNVETTNINYQAAATLLDSNKWSVFAKEGYVDNVNTSVIGTPTLEMWLASWNEKYSDTLSFDANATGYQVGLTPDSLDNYISYPDMQAKEGYKNTLYYPHAQVGGWPWNDCYGYWLATPSVASAEKVMRVSIIGHIKHDDYNVDDSEVRPVVALKFGITATQDENGVWQLEK